MTELLRVPPSIPSALMTSLSVLYSQPHRKYHDLLHVQAMLRELQTMLERNEPNTIRWATVITYAIWFHDAYYDPYATPKMNEEMSAQLFLEYVRPLRIDPNFGRFEDESGIVTDQNIELVLEAIRASAFHTFDQSHVSVPTQIFLDIDLASFGKPREEYEYFDRRVEAEYYRTSERALVEGRIAFLEKMLTRTSIYYTPFMRAAYETDARANIEHTLTRLRSIYGHLS